jgi:hypothetical protein
MSIASMDHEPVKHPLQHMFHVTSVRYLRVLQYILVMGIKNLIMTNCSDLVTT